jgi:hypothetical protein
MAIDRPPPLKVSHRRHRPSPASGRKDGLKKEGKVASGLTKNRPLLDESLPERELNWM